MIRFITPEPKAGCWQIGGSAGLRFYVRIRPRWLTRVMCKFLLEWEWIDG